MSVVSVNAQGVELELHFGYAACPAPVASSWCTNLASMNKKLIQGRIATLQGVRSRYLGSSFNYCLLDHHEDKTFGSALGSWFDTGARTVHVGYRQETTVSRDKLVWLSTPSGPACHIETVEEKVWDDPYAVAPYSYYEIILPVSVSLSDLDNKFVANKAKEEQIEELFSAVEERTEPFANLANLNDIIKLMMQVNDYKDVKLVGVTERSLLNPEMAACFTDLNVSDSSQICANLATSLLELNAHWREIFVPGESGSPQSNSPQYQRLQNMIAQLQSALKQFRCEKPPIFFAASQVTDASRIFDGGSINLLLV